LAPTSGTRGQPMLGLTTTVCPFFTNCSMPPISSIAFLNMASGSPFLTATRSGMRADFSLAQRKSGLPGINAPPATRPNERPLKRISRRLNFCSPAMVASCRFLTRRLSVFQSGDFSQQTRTIEIDLISTNFSRIVQLNKTDADDFQRRASHRDSGQPFV